VISVDIYQVRLEGALVRLDSLFDILRPQERGRSTRFAENRHLFIVCRRTLREILSSYLQTHPARIDSEKRKIRT
jgi:hypothetical protein